MWSSCKERGRTRDLAEQWGRLSRVYCREFYKLSNHISSAYIGIDLIHENHVFLRLHEQGKNLRKTQVVVETRKNSIIIGVITNGAHIGENYLIRHIGSII